MRNISVTIPENTFALTDAEIKLIHAMAYYFAQDTDGSGMTKRAAKLVCKMEEQFRNIPTDKSFEVWE